MYHQIEANFHYRHELMYQRKFSKIIVLQTQENDRVNKFVNSSPKEMSNPAKICHNKPFQNPEHEPKTCINLDLIMFH